MLYDKWWKSTKDTCAPRDKAKTSKANALNVDNIGGVFVVLLCGIAFSVLIAITEFYYNARRTDEDVNRAFDPFFYFNKIPASPGRQSLCSEMTQELCYALQCYGPRQRPTLKRQCLKCSQAVLLQRQRRRDSADDFDEEEGEDGTFNQRMNSSNIIVRSQY